MSEAALPGLDVEAVARRLTPRLQHYATRRLGDRHEAEELVQEGCCGPSTTATSCGRRTTWPPGRPASRPPRRPLPANPTDIRRVGVESYFLDCEAVPDLP